MKLKNLFAGMILCLAVASCIQDEAQNVEAAIDGCSGKLHHGNENPVG